MKYGVIVIFAVLACYVSLLNKAYAFDEVVFKAQVHLENHGYEPGPIDGILGSKTIKAIRKFQGRYEIPGDGEINELTLKELGVSLKEGLGHIKGKMLYKGKAVMGIPIFFHDIDKGRASCKVRARTDSKGRWVAVDIYPGKYVVTAFCTTGGRPLSYDKKSVVIVLEGTLKDAGIRNTYGYDRNR